MRRYYPDPGTLAGLLVILAVAIAMCLLVLGMRAHAQELGEDFTRLLEKEIWRWQSCPVGAECRQTRAELDDGTVLMWVAGGYSDDPAIERWFNEDVVKRCCSKADGFEADEYESVQGGVWATITDDGHQVCWKSNNDDDDTAGETCRRAVPDVRRIFVPEDKIIYSPRNPTGHGFLFIDQRNGPRCYFLPSGA